MKKITYERVSSLCSYRAGGIQKPPGISLCPRTPPWGSDMKYLKNIHKGRIITMKY